MANAVQLRNPKFESIAVTLSATKIAGAMDKINDTVGIYVTGGDSGDSVGFITKCEAVVLPKTAGTGITFAQGAKVYFDNTAKAVTNVSSGNTLVGRANLAALATAATVEVNFNGNAQA